MSLKCTLSKALLATFDNSPATSSVTVKQGFLSFSICFLATTSKARSGVKSPSLIPSKIVKYQRNFGDKVILVLGGAACPVMLRELRFAYKFVFVLTEDPD